MAGSSADVALAARSGKADLAVAFAKAGAVGFGVFVGAGGAGSTFFVKGMRAVRFHQGAAAGGA